MRELAKDGRRCGVQVEVARTFATRALGLLGRRSLDEGRGLWIEGCAMVHSFAMRFTIDVVMVDAGGRVVAIATLPPWRRGPRGAVAGSALELPEGAARKLGIAIGDLLTLETPCAKVTQTDASEGSIHT